MIVNDNIKLLYVDLFCGAGGTSTGVEEAIYHGKKCAKVIACVNHDPNAIASHFANHPEALHFIEDIRTLEMSRIMPRVESERREHPNAQLVLWASLECTNFSKAKGGLPRNADSRTLAEHLFRYIEAIQPDRIQVENVEEFMSWGDLDENGHPIEKLKGSSYLRWVDKVRSYGYDFDYKILNAADFGAITSRKRYFGQFAKHGLPILFPKPTYSKSGTGGRKPWKPVKSAIDFSDEGQSIFGRKKPLVEKTLERIYAGLIKFVANGEDSFLVKYNSMNAKTGKYHAPGMNAPCPTVSCQNRIGMAKVHFLSKQFSGHPQSKNISMDQPAGSTTCKDHHALITAFIANQYGHGGGQLSDIDNPSPTVMTIPKQNLVTVKKYYLMNPQYQCKGSSIDKPCFTLIARMDKAAPYLISTEEVGRGIQFSDDDSPMTRKIKEFMLLYNIVDIKMRMLKIEELKQIMGFPRDYVLVGTVAEQKKYIGNAVEVGMARALCEALCNKLN